MTSHQNKNNISRPFLLHSQPLLQCGLSLLHLDQVFKFPSRGSTIDHGACYTILHTSNSESEKVSKQRQLNKKYAIYQVFYI